jgi:tRNA(Ile)-lysidine synthase TilS/MesJ
MSPRDHITVLVSGDRKSAALLYFLKKLIADRRDIRLSAVPACEGNTSTAGQSAAIKVAESLHIPCIEMPLPGGSGTTAHNAVTKIALAISLDDIAKGVLREFLFGDVNRLIYPSLDGWCGIPVICPFIAVPSGELDHYWEIAGSGIALPPDMPARDALLQETESLLRDYTSRHPATKYALLHLAEELSSGNVAAMAEAGAGREGSPSRGVLKEADNDGT